MRALPWTLVTAAWIAAWIVCAVPAAQATWICDRPEARQFDFWFGEWDVVNKRLTEEGWVEMGHAAAKVYPVLGGCAVVEHWRGTAWDQKTIGFSVRSFDPRTGKWFLLLSWPAPDRPGFGTLEGVFSHGRGEFTQERENDDGEPFLVRYTFSDARPDALRWDAAQSEDGGRNWLTYWIMEFSRRDPHALPLFHGPWIADGRGRRCTQPEVAELDFLAGGWKGVEKRREADGSWSERAARVTVYPIVEGCALMDLVEVAGEGGYERFAVRAWSAAEERWLQYEMETPEPVFVRTVGTSADDGFVFTSEDGEGGVRVTWSRGDDGAVVREDARQDDDGAWTVHRRLELRPTFYGDRETVELE